MGKYLYGASVQGIQGFIFETNKLREITGASEIVEQICTTKFKEAVGDHFDDKNLITGAAGNIKYLFDDTSEIDVANCKRIVKNFPKDIMKFAPGITISQAVVQIKGEVSNTDFGKLEKKLRTQRNKPVTQHGSSLMISERARRNGKAGIYFKHNEVWDNSIHRKNEMHDNLIENTVLMGKFVNGLTNKNKILPEDYQKNIDKILESTDGKGWLAVIHADGNNLGKSIQKLTSKDGDKAQSAFKAFSNKLDEATITSAHNAYTKVFQETFGKEGTNTYPFRPVVLGGDDITIICRGDLAIPFLDSYLREFEKETKKKFNSFNEEFKVDVFSKGMTACAGVAFIKPNYPFHYGVELAESLCSQSKKVAKEIDPKNPKSCYLFHKVHSSFVKDYKDIVKRELTLNSNSLNEEDKNNPRRLSQGPYFLEHEDKYSTSGELLEQIRFMNEVKSPKSSLRNWLSELEVNPENAKQILKRIEGIADRKYKKAFLSNIWHQRKVRPEPKDPKEATNERTTPIHDIIALSQIMKTK